jgi:hypothetical protein
MTMAIILESDIKSNIIAHARKINPVAAYSGKIHKREWRTGMKTTIDELE